MQRRFPFVKRLLSSLSIFSLTPIFVSKIDLNQYLDRIEIADNNLPATGFDVPTKLAGECRDVFVAGTHSAMYVDEKYWNPIEHCICRSSRKNL